MKIKISSRAKLFKVLFYHHKNNTLMSTFCLARNPEEAIDTFRDEYAHEYPRDIKAYTELIKPKSDWYEFAMKNKYGSIILARNLIINS